MHLPCFSHLACLEAAAERPNVVVFMLDDAGYDDFGFMQAVTGLPTQFKTPRLDQLAAQSVVFSNAYVTGPVCSASRAGLLTGTSGSRFGVEYQIGDFGVDVRDGVPVSQQFLSQSLKALGYQTGAVGKWHLGRAPENLPQGRGFDEYFGFLSGGVNYFGFDSTE